jgi:heme/copper-type cytochrome/quinol oxidase subunit 4|tara:strand:+ start:2137 stop:2448 length:312 start_codon:yes stop_codon:yes gene_type:complete
MRLLGENEQEGKLERKFLILIIFSFCFCIIVFIIAGSAVGLGALIISLALLLLILLIASLVLGLNLIKVEPGGNRLKGIIFVCLISALLIILGLWFVISIPNN